MKRNLHLPTALLAAAFALAGCSGVDNALGLGKSSPDEFEVVVRPPLTLPPSFSLNPVDSAAPAQAQTDAVSLSEGVLGGRSASADGFDALFGTDRIEPGIRAKVDEETLGIQMEKRLAVQVLFGGRPNVGPTLSPEEEARRIQDALRDGRGLTETPTPAVDPLENQPLAIE